MQLTKKAVPAPRAVVERWVTICNLKGLHARAAGKLVNTAVQYQSKIELTNKNIVVNAKSIMGLMALGGHKGVRLLLRAKGGDAAEAVEAIAELIADRFGEDE